MQLKGMDKLLAALNTTQKINDVKRVVKMNGVEMQRSMHRNATFTRGYQTGTTKRSINLVITDGGFEANVAPTTDYSQYLEYGTRFMASQSFVRPSYYSSFFQFHEDLARLMK